MILSEDMLKWIVIAASKFGKFVWVFKAWSLQVCYVGHHILQKTHKILGWTLKPTAVNNGYKGPLSPPSYFNLLTMKPMGLLVFRHVIQQLHKKLLMKMVKCK